MKVLRVEIPQTERVDGVRWLEIEKADDGFYLYHYEDITMAPKWDSLYASLEEVIRDCRESFGILEDSWEAVR